MATEFKGKGKTISRESKTKLDFVAWKPILRVYMLIFISRKGKDDDDEDDDDDDDNDEDEDDNDDNVAHRWHRLDGIITDLVIISTD